MRVIGTVGMAGLGFGISSLLTLCVASNRDTISDSYATSMSAEQLAQIDAYIEPVKAVTRLNLPPTLLGEAKSIRQVTTDWIERSKTGQIGDVRSLTTNESTRDGVRSQITRARHTLAGACLKLAQQEVRAGKIADANGDFALAFAVCDIAKFSDLASATEALATQLDVLSAVERSKIKPDLNLKTVLSRTEGWEVGKAHISSIAAILASSTICNRNQEATVRRVVRDIRSAPYSPIAFRSLCAELVFASHQATEVVPMSRVSLIRLRQVEEARLRILGQSAPPDSSVVASR